MNTIKENIAHNLSELRKSRKMTQQELAAKLVYSDKSISKWEHGETLPSVEILQELCDFYGVTLDYLTHEVTPATKQRYLIRQSNTFNRNVIAALAVTFVWMVAIVISVSVEITRGYFYWVGFIWALPASLFIALVYQAFLRQRRYSPALLTLMVWTTLAAVYCQLGFSFPDNKGWNLWVIFLLGIPATVAAVLWSHIKNPAKPIEK